MKEQYFADERDYFKYSILRHLIDQEISCTVCWMMTPDDDGGDGQVRGYLNNEGVWHDNDPLVFHYLKEQVDGGAPDIRSVERSSPIARCRFDWAPFPPDHASRAGYFYGCLAKAAGTNLVFLDPDIGPEPAQINPNDLDKYVRWHEIDRIYKAGHSVIVFNFLPSQDAELRNRLVQERSQKLQNMLGNAEITVLRSNLPAFYFAVHDRDMAAVGRAREAILARWNNQQLWRAV